jgi:hypothetical protein
MIVRQGGGRTISCSFSLAGRPQKRYKRSHINRLPTSPKRQKTSLWLVYRRAFSPRIIVDRVLEREKDSQCVEAHPGRITGQIPTSRRLGAEISAAPGAHIARQEIE